MKVSGELSRDEARRLALASQGFDRALPQRVTAASVRRALRQLAVLQLDYVNVLVPAHNQWMFSRLGAYPLSLLDRVLYGGEFAECWAHEASAVPLETWPLLRHRREEHQPSRPLAALLKKHGRYFEKVLEQVEKRGPVVPDDLDGPGGPDDRTKSFRGRPIAKEALEWHFARGDLAVTERRRFARVYDLSERVIPREQLRRRVERDEAQRQLLLLAARAHGFGTAADLADYFRMAIREVRPRLAELVEAKQLRPTKVEGWRELAYLHPKAVLPDRIDVARLVSPFDPLVWSRDRVARLFDFEFRIEIFVQAAKRKWGYYVLPFLMGDQLVARVDLKAERSERRLLVLAAYREPNAKAGPVAESLAAELRTLADWLDLDDVRVAARGNLSRPLRSSVAGG